MQSKDRGLQRASLWAIAEMAEHMKPGLQLKYGPKLLKMVSMQLAASPLASVILTAPPDSQLIRAMEEPELLKHA